MSTLIPGDLPLPSGAAPSARAEAAPVSVSVGTSRRTGAANRAGGETVEPRYQAKGLITSDERQHLGRLARQAWEKCGAKGAGIPCDEWRHEQVEIATEEKAKSLHEVRRGQYRDVLKHFLELAGDSARAFRVAQRSGQGAADRDLALAKLKEACESGELAYPDYPEAICRKQFKCGLDDLETGKVWFLFYTCQTRARAKNKKASEIASKGPMSAAAPITLPDACDAQEAVGGPGESYGDDLP